MFTPPKSTGADFINMTVLNTPQPQATSTIQRKSILESKFLDEDVNEVMYKRPAMQKCDATQKSNESSLGILDNINSFLTEMSEIGDTERQRENKLDTEREFARKLLQRCSGIGIPSVTHDTDKENNANIQNLSDNVTTLTLINQDHPKNENIAQSIIKKANSVVFEPNEISARSSGLSNSSEKHLSSTSNKNINAITFDATTAELMAQFNNEEFYPASEMASQMLADEVSWQQNYSYALPTTASGEKEYLNLSCFSGIIGELDLSVESCAGHKVSVDEFFRRKCGNFGELSDNAIERPSLGLSVNSPKKKDQLMPLVDSTITTKESSVGSSMIEDKVQRNDTNTIKDVEEQSIMSLSSIAQALQDIDSGTPRKLVDQLIMAKKKKKLLQKENVTRDTYTLLSTKRKSVPAIPSRSIEHFDKDMEILNLSSKSSLDSKLINETVDAKHSIPRIVVSVSDTNAETSCQELKRDIKNRCSTPLYNRDFKSFLQNTNLPLSYYNKKQKSVILENEEIGKKEIIKEENISCKENSEISQNNSNLQGLESQLNNVVIGRNTEELCNCIVGMLRETDIELLNKSDRWVVCSLSVNQVQGDKQNVQLVLLKDVILIKPNTEKRAKIGLTVLKMCKPIITVLNITVSDMVTKTKQIMKHIICFKPEEININVVNPSQKRELNFHCIVENSITTLPIIITNKNSIDIPIVLSILQDGLSVFSFVNSNKLQHIILKPQEAVTVLIQCKGVLPKDTEIRSSRYDGNLLIQTKNVSDSAIIIKEVPLIVQVETCKVQVIDTELPLIISNKQTKPFTVINLGNISVMTSVSFIQDIEFAKISKYFSVQPENLLLQPSETGSFFITYKQQNVDIPKIQTKIKLTAANNIYHYSVIGESNSCFNMEAENENFLRCETPQYLSPISSPSSPHSVASNKSGISGRNSPLSTVSGSTVVSDKIPIRTTHAALLWNSVKTGKSEIKEFTIRNTSNNKIKIQAVISDSDKNFRFLRERQSVGTSIVLVLQGSESRTLSVVFSPYHLGAATGKIVFKHYEPRKEDESRSSKVLFLYGYGGYSKVEISEAFKDTSGKMWLSLGSLNSGGSLNAKIKLKNTGDLCSYIKIKLIPKAVYPTMVSSWHVNPTELLLNPKEIQWVTLEFHPKKEDLVLLRKSDVSHVGTILITHGDEPSRWRIRRLYNKMKESGELNGNENEVFRNIVYSICTAFPGEQVTSDIKNIRDSVQNLGDLCRGIRQHEIMLTMEVCADETLSVFHDNADESQMFYSLCSDNSHIYEGNGESFLSSEAFMENKTLQHDTNADNFIVSPLSVTLTPPIRTEATVIIKSSCAVAQPFETSLSNTEYLSAVPAEGMIHLKINNLTKLFQSIKQRISLFYRILISKSSIAESVRCLDSVATSCTDDNDCSSYLIDLTMQFTIRDKSCHFLFNVFFRHIKFDCHSI